MMRWALKRLALEKPRSGLAVDWEAEVERACGSWPIGRGEKAMSDYDREVGRYGKRVQKWLKANPVKDGQDTDPQVVEGWDAVIEKTAEKLEAQPVGRPFHIVSGDGKFYDTE